MDELHTFSSAKWTRILRCSVSALTQNGEVCSADTSALSLGMRCSHLEIWKLRGSRGWPHVMTVRVSAQALAHANQSPVTACCIDRCEVTIHTHQEPQQPQQPQQPSVAILAQAILAQATCSGVKIHFFYTRVWPLLSVVNPFPWFAVCASICVGTVPDLPISNSKDLLMLTPLLASGGKKASTSLFLNKNPDTGSHSISAECGSGVFGGEIRV